MSVTTLIKCAVCRLIGPLKRRSMTSCAACFSSKETISGEWVL